MTPKLPAVSGEELIRALTRFGYAVVRQKGSHVRMRHATDAQRQPVTIPVHAEVARGTLRRILRDAEITVEQLLAVL